MENSIQKTITTYEELRKNKYKITIDEDGYRESNIVLSFLPEHYHHLVGFHYLTDMPTISNPVSKHKFYKDIKKGKITANSILKSAKYCDISSRVEHFDKLLEILSCGSGKVIIEFDPSIPNSKVVARFCLFLRDKNVPFGKHIYYNLFIDCDYVNSTYFPTSYFVEESNRYIRDQNLLDCTISYI